MKKTFILLISNIIIMIFLALILEFVCAFIGFNSIKSKDYSFFQKIKKTIKLSIIHYSSPIDINYENRIRPFNRNIKYKKDSIILTGCSFTYGDGLKNEEAFHSILSQYAQRNIINLGICCASPKETLYILSNEKNRNKFIDKTNDIEYIFYTYIPDHKKRLYVDVCQFMYIPNFVPDSNFSKLTYKPKNRISALLISYNFFRAFYYKNFINKDGKDLELLFLYFKEINKTIKQYFTNSKGEKTKFVILVYEEDGNENWNLLKKEDITIININKLTNVNLKYAEYRLKDWHPNAKAWQIIVPALVKELDL